MKGAGSGGALPEDDRSAPQPLATIEEIAHEFEEGASPAADLSAYAVEDWLTLAVFWAMGVCVFLQFLTRYALNNSLGWTEEVAINCLMVVVFLGSATCVRLGRHIHVDILYRFIPAGTARVLSLGVDVFVIGFFAYLSWLIWNFVGMVADQRMISIDVPRSLLFYTILGAFLLMLVRAVQVLALDLRRGWSALERPGASEGAGS